MADKFQLKALITGVDKLSPMLKGIQKNAGTVRKQLEKSGLGKIGFADVVKGGVIAAPFVMGVKAAISFESKMADVKKVVDFDTPKQFKQMGRDVLDLGTKMPMLANNIAEIIAAAGQANIPREELLDFSKDAVKMAVAFDETAENAGKMMATWRTAFKVGQAGVVELADKINYLGNTGPANTKQISAIVTRLGALGEVAGLGTGQLAALGATLAGVGVGEEVAATGMKNFMLTLGAGAAASSKQQQTFRALRLDSKQVAVDMQRDAEGTILRVLTAISKVDKAKQSAVLMQLVGRESIGAIAPMLTNLDLLKSNLDKVGDATAYVGSMQKEYDSRAATTANALVLLQGRAVKLGVTLGNMLLPPFNEFLDVIGPVVNGVSELVAVNPWLVKTVLGAAAGFAVLRLSVLAGIVALKVFGAVSSLTPLGLAVRGIALLAGVLIANWKTVGPFFGEFFKRLGVVAEFAWGMLKGIFSWTPLGLIISNWGPITEWMSALWRGAVASVGLGMAMLGRLIDWTPLGIITRNWEPIVAWFGRMWDRIKPLLQPILNGASKVAQVASWFFSSGEAAPVPPQQQAADASARRPGWVAGDRSLEGTRHSIVTQSAQAQKTQLNGQIAVRFENAPEGMQVTQAKTDQPGVEATPFVGYRSLGRRRTSG